MGKKDYAVKLYGTFENIADLSRNIDDIRPGLITNIHEGTKIL